MRSGTPAIRPRALASWVLLATAACATQAPPEAERPVVPTPVVTSVTSPASGPETPTETASPSIEQAPAPLPPPSIDARSLDELRRAVAALAKRSPAGRARRAVFVVDAATSQTVLEEGADESLIPASNAKLFTTAAALDRLGEEHTMSTRLLATAAATPEGIIDGDLFLASDDDFSWSLRAPKDSGAVVDKLVDSLAEAKVRKILGEARAEGLFFVERTSADEYDEDAQRGKARARLLAALRRHKIEVGHAKTSESQARVELASSPSSPLLEACAPILRVSHNGFADVLLRHLGRSIEHEATAKAGARAVSAWLTSAEIPEKGVHLADGSGLSREDRATPRALVKLLLFMQSKHPSFVSKLAIAGETGTIARRLMSPDTRGRVFAKTGTLAEVTALSGYLDNRHDGRRYVFAILLNGVPDIAAGRKLEDSILEALAAPWSRSGS